jgi:hypothetical protein
MDVQPNVRPEQYREGKVAKAIEQQTAKIPSDLFLWAAVGAMGVSLIGQLTQPRRMSLFNMPSRSGQLGLFFGQWVPTLLFFGLYNKIIKLAGGSDRASIKRNNVH